jgi:small conductance mechanosensitive channel
MIIQAALADVGQKLMGWGYSLILLLPNFIAAAIVMLVAWGFSRLTRNLVRQTMRRASSQVMLANLLATICQWLVLIVALFISLGILKLDKTVTSLLAGAGVIGLALAFAFQDIASNFLAGILLAIRRPFRPGDIISTNDFLGTVDELNLRSTQLRTPQGQVVILPNASVFQKPITNLTMLRVRRVDIDCRISYTADLDYVEKLTLEALRDLPMLEKKRPVDFYYTEFAESSITFRMRFWIPFSRQPDYLHARSEAIKTIKGTFDKAGISIPLPTQTLEIAGDGGERLPTALTRSPHFRTRHA